MTAARRAYQHVWRVSRRAGALAMAVLRELSDERAYARHLAICGRLHSAEEWRRFSDERLRSRFARAKCC